MYILLFLSVYISVPLLFISLHVVTNLNEPRSVRVFVASVLLRVRSWIHPF